MVSHMFTLKGLERWIYQAKKGGSKYFIWGQMVVTGWELQVYCLMRYNHERDGPDRRRSCGWCIAEEFG